MDGNKTGYDGHPDGREAEELAIKMKSARQVETMVIDHAEKPSEN